MKCKNCGAEVREGVTFCGTCGSRVPVNFAKEEKKRLKKLKLEKKKLPKKERPPMGCLGFLVEMILFILLIVIVVVLVSKGIKWYKNYKYDEVIEQNIYFSENQNIKLTEEQKKEDWNYDGISNNDARDLNLNITVKDSDGDGLTDYDEINIYKSNPLKYSTSGDLYNDGYKVKFGYKMDMKYETYKTIDVENSKLKLEANDAYDMGVYYKKYTGAIPDGYYLAFEPFRLFSFDGEANLEITNPNDFEVISYDTIERKTKKIQSRVEGDYLVFDVIDDNPLLIVYKEKVLESMEEGMINSINSSYSNQIIKEYYVLSSPLYSILTGNALFIMEVDNYKAGNVSDQVLVDYLNNKYKDIGTFKHSYINATTATILDKILSNVVYDASDYLDDYNKYWTNLFVVYGHCQGLDELETLLVSKVSDSKDKNDVGKINDLLSKKFNDKYANMSCGYCADSGFNVMKNAFSFKNPSTVMSSSLSAGMSVMTTSIYNNFGLMRRIDNVYDMTDGYYNNMWNKDLYNQQLGEQLAFYADQKYENNKLLDSSKLSKQESELVKALEFYQKDFEGKNSNLLYNWHWNNLRKKQSFISGEAIDKLVNVFKNGKILTTYLYNDNKNHVVNAYKLVEDRYDPDVLYLKVYDSNFSNDMFWNKDENYIKQDTTIVLKRVYENTWNGSTVKYIYDYNPLERSSYHFSNFNGGLDAIAFIDEYGNVYN